MNRQDIVTCIDHHLREESAGIGHARPLGEVVAEVASELRAGNPFQESAAQIPIWQVSGFVDGTLSPEEERTVCEAIIHDNSVLAEVVSAMRANLPTDGDTPDLSGELRARLVGLMPQDNVNVRVVQAESNRPAKLSAMTKFVIASGAIAATVALAIYWNNKQPDETHLDNLVTQSPGMSPQPGIETPESVVDPAETPDPQSQIASEESTDSNPIATVENPPSVPIKIRSTTPPTVHDNPLPENRPAETPLMSQYVKFEDPTWTKVSGILAERSQSDPSDYSTGFPWQMIKEGDSRSSSVRPTVLKTLPLSRAQANFQSGGRFVLSPDTGIRLALNTEKVSCAIHIDHGALAMMDMPEGSVIALRFQNGAPIELNWHSQGSVIASVTSVGLEIHRRTGDIGIAGARGTSESLVVGTDNQQTTIEKPKRLPKWVNGSVETLPRTVLAQFDDSKDLAPALQQSLQRFNQVDTINVRDQRNALILGKMYASLVGPNAFRLLSSPNAMIRTGALMMLAELNEWDARSRVVWAAATRLTREPRSIIMIRRLITHMQNGGKPSAQQIDQMLNGLESDEIWLRAMSDFLLRSSVGGGPPFDPTWTAANRARAVNAWRKFTGRSTRTLGAAATGNRVQP